MAKFKHDPDEEFLQQESNLFDEFYKEKVTEEEAEVVYEKLINIYKVWIKHVCKELQKKYKKENKNHGNKKD